MGGGGGFGVCFVRRVRTFCVLSCVGGRGV